MQQSFQKLLSTILLLGLAALVQASPPMPGITDNLPAGNEWLDLIGTYKYDGGTTQAVFEEMEALGAEYILDRGRGLTVLPEAGMLLMDDGGWVIGLALFNGYEYIEQFFETADVKWPLGFSPEMDGQALSDHSLGLSQLEYLTIDNSQFQGLQTAVFRLTYKNKSNYITALGASPAAGFKVMMVLIPPTDLGEFAEKKLFAVQDGELWGFIDQFGNTIVSPTYSDVDKHLGFNEGLIAVELEGKWGYMDRTGTMIIEAQFDRAEHFSQGRALVGAADGDAIFPSYTIGYIDKSGKQITRLEYDDTFIGEYFSNGLCVVKQNDLMGYINLDGELAIPLSFHYASTFEEGLAVVQDKKDGPYRYINMRGEPAFDGKWLVACKFNDSRAVVGESPDGPFKCIDRFGKQVFEFPFRPQFMFGTSYFKNGKIQVRQDDMHGFVDTAGTVIVQPVYTGATRSFSENRAGLSLDGNIEKGQVIDKVTGNWGFVDELGDPVTGFDYYDAASFSEGMAAVQLDEGGLWGYLNPLGDWLIEPMYEQRPGYFSYGLAKVGNGYINRKGAWVWKP